MDYYCNDVYQKTPEQIFDDIKSEINKNGDTGKALKFLDDFVNWLRVDHPNIILKIKGRKHSTFTTEYFIKRAKEIESKMPKYLWD